MIRRILLTNDDGIDAPGLATLATVLGGHFEVYVVAPDRERSGVGHSFTLFTPLRCDPVQGLYPAELVAGAWKCSGTPVDCVKMGLLEVMRDRPPDLVVAGINRGANLGIDTLYSGTVSAAMEAMILGKPSIAVSLVYEIRATATHNHFASAAEWVLEFITSHTGEIESQDGYFFNINVPGIPRDEIRGWRYTRLGRGRYDDRFQMHKDPSGRPYYWLEGALTQDEQPADSDLTATRSGFISVTPLHNDISAHHVLDRLAEAEPGHVASRTDSSARP